MWTVGHAHGALLALVNATFAATMFVMPDDLICGRRLASGLLIAAGILLPGGFCLGGLTVYGADPGPGVWLVPFGGISLFVGVLLTAMGLVTNGPSGESGKRNREK